MLQGGEKGKSLPTFRLEFKFTLRYLLFVSCHFKMEVRRYFQKWKEICGSRSCRTRYKYFNFLAILLLSYILLASTNTQFFNNDKLQFCDVFWLIWLFKFKIPLEQHNGILGRVGTHLYKIPKYKLWNLKLSYNWKTDALRSFCWKSYTSKCINI